MLPDTGLRVACDSLVALGSATEGGEVLFAKNSDRPAFECQPLVQLAAQSFEPGAQLRCTYIEIPQARRTARLIGSKPHWCWGFEHGLNEHGVAIGNHTVFTKDELAGVGLIGMDVVRLGLERSRDCDEALAEMTRLIETHGQGGSGYGDKDWPYHNSFLVADRHSAFLLETSDRRWAVRRIADVGSASNHLTIGNDWSALSEGLIEHAVANGWWDPDGDKRFDFAAAYRDTSIAPEVVSSGRHRRTCTLLDRQRGAITGASLMAALRDHYDLPAPCQDRTPMDPEYFSVCMHAEPVGTTTASMVASIPAEGCPIYFAGMASPCVGAFVPLFVDAAIPSILSRGSLEPSEESPWWRLKHLLSQVECDWQERAPRVRAEMNRFEQRLYDEAYGVARAGARIQEQFMAQAIDELLALVSALREELAS